jgi:PAS domain S-box-containing protein
MLDLLKGGTEDTLGIIEREMRCGFWSWNLRTNEMQWSRGYYDLLGIAPGKVTPSFAAILQVTHPDDRGLQADVERIIRKASTIRRKFRVIRRGGNIAWIYCQIIIFVDMEGSCERALGICTDITAREDQLNRLQLTDERYRALIKATDGVVWIAKSDGQIHEVINCDHSGELQAVALESGWQQFIHPDDREKVIRVREAASREKRSYEVVHRLRQADGAFKWKRSAGQPVLDDAGNIKEWLGISFDLERDTAHGGTRRITGAQIRAARGLLRWSVLDLAQAAGTTRSTIRRLEEQDGASSHSDPAVPSIELALSKAGVEFLFPAAGKPGVRPR